MYFKILSTLALSAALAVGVAGCGKKDDKAVQPEPAAKPDPGTPEAAVPAKPGAAVLTLADMKITAEGEDGAIAIQADGKIVVEDEHVATIHTDGRVVSADGEEVGKIDAAGKVTITGEDETFTIAEDGTVAHGDQTVRIDENGMLVGAEAEEDKIKVEGPAAGRRAAMLAFMLAMTPHEVGDDPAGEGEAEAEAEAE